MLDVATLFECATRSLLHDLVRALPNECVLMPEKVPEQIVTVVHTWRFFMNEGRALTQALYDLQCSIESGPLEDLHLDRRQHHCNFEQTALLVIQRAVDLLGEEAVDHLTCDGRNVPKVRRPRGCPQCKAHGGRPPFGQVE